MDARARFALKTAEAEWAESVSSARSFVQSLHEQLARLERQQRRLLEELRPKEETHEDVPDPCVALEPVCQMESEVPSAGSRDAKPADLQGTSSEKKWKYAAKKARSAGITKDHDIEAMRRRLRAFNESASRILGGRWEMNCDKGVSMVCMVSSPFFDAVAAFLILFNSFIVGWEVEWSTSSTAENPVIEALSSFCNLVFLVELILRLYAFRMDFFFNRERRAWNIFDFILVVLAVVDEISVLALGTEASTGAVGSVKMLKMLRILRIFRVFRFFRPLARLALMIIDSIRSLLWAMFMLGLISYVFAVTLTGQATMWLTEQVDTSLPDWYDSLAHHQDINVRLIWSSYGCLGWTVYTLAQTVLDGVSWHEVLEPLFSIGWLPVSLLLLYISFTMLAVLNVITGVFVDNAFRSADKQHIDIIQREIDKKEECMSLIEAFFNAVDVNQTGEISMEELAWFLDDATMDAFFRVLGFDVYDKTSFMELLDADDNGNVSYDEFREGCMRFRGVAQGLDLHLVLRPDCRPELPEVFEMEGFQMKRFNVTFTARRDLQVNGLPTYWDECGQLFIYWQVSGSRWAVCPRSDDSRKDLLNSVRSGEAVGMAYEEADTPGLWSEYTESGFEPTTVRLRHLRESEGPNSPRGKRISRWRKEAQERAANSRSGSQMPKSLEDMKHLLESRSDVEEVFVIQGPKEAELVVSFRSQRTAEDAVELGQGLLDAYPDVVKDLTSEEVERLRDRSQGGYRPCPGRSEHELQPVMRSGNVQSTARSKAKASPQKSGDEAEAEKPPNRRAERPELEQSNSLQQLTELVQSLSKPTSAPALPSPPPAQKPEPLQPSTEKELPPHPRESEGLEVCAENDLDFAGLDLQELLLQQESNQSQEFGDPREAEATADGTGSLKSADAPSRTSPAWEDWAASTKEALKQLEALASSPEARQVQRAQRAHRAPHAMPIETQGVPRGAQPKARAEASPGLGAQAAPAAEAAGAAQAAQAAEAAGAAQAAQAAEAPGPVSNVETEPPAKLKKSKKAKKDKKAKDAKLEERLRSELEEEFRLAEARR
ncbi:unnamed protein product [Effrenium voratum]|nr:unnamed protein product [Effrenium voratum]